MQLSDLLKFDDIVIQCHDNPDADALASGFALYTFFEKAGKKPQFIYRGVNQIVKSNLTIMVEDINIPISYEPDFGRKPELLITCDCQYGQKNVTLTPAENIAVIDHHQVTVELPELSDVRSSVGSCSTVVWDMLRAEGFNVTENKSLSTALYYGLYTDTNRLSELFHPLDRDMLDSLIVNKSLVTKMSNANISLEELEITGEAILNYEYHEERRYLILRSKPCDPNILGLISDFIIETAGVDICLAYYVSPSEIKLSVRSCTREIHANELAEFIADGIGGGGGHITKAGATIRPELLTEDADTTINQRMINYYDKYEVLYADKITLDMEGMVLYEKMDQKLGAVKLSDVFPVGTQVEVRTMEGDATFTISDDQYLIIGIEGEIWPISAEKLSNSYNMTGFKYQGEFEYEPEIKDIASGEIKHVLPFAMTIISPPGSARIYAKPLDHAIKLFTIWNDEKYYSGNIGDFIAVREDDPHDIYIVNGRLFDKLYKPAGPVFR
ncbi:MAG: DHH family phosphoesterase [Saccharofermentans sp.]|nr:DHH family phosphoesterase [Saccharofermentans sp.]